MQKTYAYIYNKLRASPLCGALIKNIYPFDKYAYYFCPNLTKIETQYAKTFQ